MQSMVWSAIPMSRKNNTAPIAEKYTHFHSWFSMFSP